MNDSAAALQRLALAVEISGRGYHGTAVQPAAVPTVHGHLQEILSLLDRRQVSLRFAGRLDAGVAAVALPCHVDLQTAWDPVTLGRAINGHLEHGPDGGAQATVLAVAVVDPSWDAWRSASGKTYRYTVIHRGSRPVREPAALWLRRLTNPQRLHDCAALLCGTHDLSGFACLRGDPSDQLTPRRRILEAAWSPQDIPGGRRWQFRITGEGFLYKQVRGLVGAMLHCATHPQATVGHFAATIAGGRQAPRLGQVAPAHGLCCESVHYPDGDPDWQWL